MYYSYIKSLKTVELGCILSIYSRKKPFPEGAGAGTKGPEGGGSGGRAFPGEAAGWEVPSGRFTVRQQRCVFMKCLIFSIVVIPVAGPYCITAMAAAALAKAAAVRSSIPWIMQARKVELNVSPAPVVSCTSTL